MPRAEIVRDRRRSPLRRIVALLRPYAGGEGWPLATGALISVSAVVLHVLRPWPLKWILDYVSGKHATGPVVTWVASAPTAGIALLSLLFVAIGLALAGAEYAQMLLLNGLGNRVLFRFRAALFGHILRQPLAFHESREVGELLTRVVYDTSRLRRGLNGLLTRVFQTLALFGAILLVLLWIDPALGVVLAVGGLAALVAMRRRGPQIARAARKQRMKEGGLAGLVANELKSIRELQTFGLAGSAVLQRFSARNKGSLRQEQKVRTLAAGLSMRVEILLALSIAVTLWLGTHAVLTGRLTPGALVLFFSYAMALRGPFLGFAYQTARLGRTYASADRLGRIVERTSAIADRPDAIPAPPLAGDLRFEEVALKSPKVRRGGRKWTLDGLTCRLPAGRRIAVLGPNGAGKSTLLSLVLRLADPDRGRILLDGRELPDYALESLRSQMSVVFQDSVLSGLSVRDNIALGRPEASMDAVQAAAQAAHISRFIERLPQGYDTPVRRGGELFSGGERQRLALARALLRDGRIWLLDEPTTGLDRGTAGEVTDALFEATRGRTTLWVTHDSELIPRFDWVLVLKQGSTLFSGSSDTYPTWLAQREAVASPAMES
jgi:ATP-binding cassette subfamily B protein